jgi:GMP synthase-like glutamine amidotransferase
MQPITIFRFSRTEGPGYFATFLDRQRLPWKVVALDAGEPVPQSVDDMSGIAMMGGPMSVNDDLPWVKPMESMLRRAVDADVPVLGHCLGGQLLAKALGATVRRSPNEEIGWHRVDVEASPIAREWVGDDPSWTTFQWHNESFDLPQGSMRVLTNAACPNQAYVIGNSIGLQGHVEMTGDLVRTWIGPRGDGGGDLSPENRKNKPYVQSPEQITAQLDRDIETLHRRADLIYRRWIEGLR